MVLSKGKFKWSNNDKSTEPAILHQRQSKLDLLDTTTFTSFPAPELIKEINKPSEDMLRIRSNVRQRSVERINSRSTRSKSRSTLGDSKTIIEAKDIPNQNPKSETNFNFMTSLGSAEYTANHISKNETPPSSCDHESPFYDYRLLLEEKDASIWKIETVKEDSSTADTKVKPQQNEGGSQLKPIISSDMYIQSIYDELYKSEEVSIEIKCSSCFKPVFENHEYINKILDLKAIICEDCMNIRYQPNESFNKSVSQFSTFEIENFTELNSTNNTVQIYLESTANENEDEITDNGRPQEIRFFSNNDSNITEFVNQGLNSVIKRLKEIERKDLKIRHSIADFRQVQQMQRHRNGSLSLWGTIKHMFLKSNYV